MDYNEFKNKFPVGVRFKCSRVSSPSSIEDRMWNSMVDQELTFEVKGHVYKNVISQNDQYTIIIKVYDYNINVCTLSTDYLEDEHFFYVTKDRTHLLSIVGSENVVIDNSSYPHTCPRCGAPAYVGLLNTDCSKGCS